MLYYAVGVVTKVMRWDDDTEEIEVTVDGETRRALLYRNLVGNVHVKDEVLLNTTAQRLHLGTGGCDFVIANLTMHTVHRKEAEVARNDYARRGVPVARHPSHGLSWSSKQYENKGHIIKGRYTPLQQAVLTLEEQDKYAEVWGKSLDNFPVLVGQLHSQIAPAAAALAVSGRSKIAYIMTDQAALPLAFSTLVRQLKAAGLLAMTITCGQAFGGDWETVTLHSALLAARHIGGCDAAIVCQGPGNAGTGTRYGFSGIEQAQNLDIVSALGGMPIAIVRMSSADQRERHSGISHHTRTTLVLTHSRCIVPLPAGVDISALPAKHDIRHVEGAEAAMELLDARNIRVTTMGRTHREDPAFFLAAAAAGLVLPTQE